MAIDSSPTLIRYEGGRPNGIYLLSDAAALPFPDASFDLAVAYNSLTDVADMPATVQEAARILRPWGRLCISVTHRLATQDVSPADDHNPVFHHRGCLSRTPKVSRRPRAGRTEDDLPRLVLPLEDYPKASEAAGLVIEAIREPTPTGPRPEYKRWRRLPMFLQLRAMKPD